MEAAEAGEAEAAIIPVIGSKSCSRILRAPPSRTPKDFALGFWLPHAKAPRVPPKKLAQNPFPCYPGLRLSGMFASSMQTKPISRHETALLPGHLK